MRPSLSMKIVEPSFIAPEMKFHIIRPTVTCGRKSASGSWNSMDRVSRAGDDKPPNQTDADMWKETCQRQLEEHGIQQSQCQSHHASSDGDPERSQNRTTVAQLNVMQT